MDLAELRNRLDDIDRQIVELYEQRMEICGEVAAYKLETGKRVFDKEREQQKLSAVSAMTHNALNAQGIRELYEQIMAISRKLQRSEERRVGKDCSKPCRTRWSP